ncbi:hypothetical protein ACIRS1_05270 [Kitasatospora sp. NPDC101176]|uniref:hypothetical protein n=1 Tax=Kitasatospora sp. NPDC101176 TaxID=3364099 RepID=UPI00382788AE
MSPQSPAPRRRRRPCSPAEALIGTLTAVLASVVLLTACAGAGAKPQHAWRGIARTAVLPVSHVHHADPTQRSCPYAGAGCPAAGH